MAKNREAITCNGRPAFFASMYEDIRKCAMDCGWAVALHGSLLNDMDIMAMPWTKNATTFEGLVRKITKLFDGNPMSYLYSISYNEKPHGRIVATIPIWGDFYLDISAIKTSNTRNPVDDVLERLEEELRLADKEKERVLKESPMQFDTAKGYANGIANAIEIVKEVATDDK